MPEQVVPVVGVDTTFDVATFGLLRFLQDIFSGGRSALSDMLGTKD